MQSEVPPAAGTIRDFDGVRRIFYGGYWIKYYPVPTDTLLAKKRLIEALSRRLFNHAEHGLDIAGNRLDEARHAYEGEQDPGKKRVKGAMYAGAMFNRATDIFSHLVDLQASGVEIKSSNDLMRECGRCLQDALALSRLVQHRSGEEGIDEMWGEPFRAFSVPLEEFFEGRCVKMAQAMRDIDSIADALLRAFVPLGIFEGLEPAVRALAAAARSEAETLRLDPAFFDVWAELVTAGERLVNIQPWLIEVTNEAERRRAELAAQIIRNGRDLIFYIARARVSMPKSTREFIERCDYFSATGNVGLVPVPLPG